MGRKLTLALRPEIVLFLKKSNLLPTMRSWRRYVGVLVHNFPGMSASEESSFSDWFYTLSGHVHLHVLRGLLSRVDM
jgi:hypothetical protein